MTRFRNSVISMDEWLDRKRLTLMTQDHWEEMNGYDPVVTINGVTEPVTNLPNHAFRRFIEICREIDAVLPHASEGIEALSVDDEANFHQALINAGAAQIDPTDETIHHRMITGDALQVMMVRVEEFE